jgi:hypothetical protein
MSLTVEVYGGLNKSSPQLAWSKSNIEEVRSVPQDFMSGAYEHLTDGVILVRGVLVRMMTSRSSRAFIIDNRSIT